MTIQEQLDKIIKLLEETKELMGRQTIVNLPGQFLQAPQCPSMKWTCKICGMESCRGHVMG